MGSLRVASERRALMESEALAEGRNGAISALPAGVCHAYEADEDETLCGEPLDGLVMWPDRDFLAATMLVRCGPCLNRARQS
jgi:hypothetical protein